MSSDNRILVKFGDQELRLDNTLSDEEILEIVGTVDAEYANGRVRRDSETVITIERGAGEKG